MSIWSTRGASLAAIESSLAKEAGLVEELLDILANCAKHLELVDSPLARTSALCTVKARNLALASYSLALDALGQEAGALLRPLIETMELIAYLRADPSRVDEAIEGRLPNGGKRAQAIDGKFQKWREYLNSHASHFGFTIESLRHLLDGTTLELRVSQPFREEVLRENLKTLFAVLFFCAAESIRTLDAAEPGTAVTLARRVDEVRARGAAVFKVSPSTSDPPSG